MNSRNKQRAAPAIQQSRRLDRGPKGRPIDGGDSEDHFTQCPGCGAMVDMRDLGQVFDHVGELPHVSR